MDVKAIKLTVDMLVLSRRLQEPAQIEQGFLDRLFLLTGSNSVAATVRAQANMLIRAELAHAEAIRKADAELKAARDSMGSAVAGALTGEAKQLEIRLWAARADSDNHPALESRLAEIRKALQELSNLTGKTHAA